MLVYFDPWLAGVVLPTLIIVGLMAIPYIDTNPKGNGYYTFRERKWEIGDLPLRLPRALVVPDHHRHVPSRPELELLRPLRILGPEQARSAGQRRSVGAIWVKVLGMPLPKLWVIREMFGHHPRRSLTSACRRCWRPDRSAAST